VIKSFRRIRDVDLRHKSLVKETASASIRRLAYPSRSNFQDQRLTYGSLVGGVKRKSISALPSYKIKTKLHGLSPRANYNDRATVACRRSDCQLLRIRGCHVVSVTDPYGHILGFLDRSRYLSIK
jgi:hypothetical protein